MAKTKLQAARLARPDYTQSAVVADLVKLARVRNVPVMKPGSLAIKLSRWENGHEQVSEPYRRLFREIYGRTNEELGFPPDPHADDAHDLLDRLAIGRTVDEGTVDAFAAQVEAARRLDRRFGGVTQLDVLRGLIDQVQDMLRYGGVGGHRAALATVLADAATLAGWEALDRNAVRSAWDLHETAKHAAREAESPTLFAHAAAQQALILTDLGQPDHALEQLAHARQTGDGVAPRLMRAWLAAAHGEGLAAAGDADGAARAFDAAHTLLPSNPREPDLPFLFLAAVHLDRWRGNALAKLGDPAAIAHLEAALPQLPADFTRARAAMLVDLAYAHSAAGDRDTAREHAREAKRTAARIKSDRQLRRLDGLILPEQSPPARYSATTE